MVACFLVLSSEQDPWDKYRGSALLELSVHNRCEVRKLSNIVTGSRTSFAQGLLDLLQGFALCDHLLDLFPPRLHARKPLLNVSFRL